MLCACSGRRGIGGVYYYGGSEDLVSHGALVGAADWVRLLLTGSVSFVVATLAIATIGLLMLAGRLHMRRAGQIVLGCFILFSAPTIAAGLVSINDDVRAEPAPETETETPAAMAYQPTVPKPEQKDPYAGAAVPPPQQDDW